MLHAVDAVVRDIEALDIAGAGPGHTLLIHGGAGAVAHYAIQMAKMKGARVISTVSSPTKAVIAKAAGADHIVDYKSEDVGERIQALTDKKGVDAVLEVDLSANAALIPKTVRAKGAVVVYGTGPQATIPSSFCLVNSIRMMFMIIYELSGADRERCIADVTKMLDQNRLTHNLAGTFKLEEIVAAHQAQESGKTVGNIVLKLG